MTNRITFLFLDGRTGRIYDKNYADDFFYGYRYFLTKYKNVKIIEMKKAKKNNLRNFIGFIDNLLRKISNCSFFLNDIVNLQNFKIIKNTEILIITNDRLGFSSLPFLIYLKIKKRKVIMFVMGMIKIEYKYFFIKFFNTLFTKILIKLCSNLIFLSENECLEAKEKHKNQANKMEYIPFCVDTNFWQRSKNYTINKNILFIGNDGKRDYKLVKEIANKLENFKITLISRRINKKGLNKNIKLINTSWKSNDISDNELKKYYEDASLVFLPLTNSLQPSGQSVALQAMSMGVPVIISDTEGFWDRNNLKNDKNIFLVKNFGTEDWFKKIIDLTNDKEILSKNSYESQKVVREFYDKDILINRLNELVNS